MELFNGISEKFCTMTMDFKEHEVNHHQVYQTIFGFLQVLKVGKNFVTLLVLIQLHTYFNFTFENPALLTYLSGKLDLT